MALYWHVKNKDELLAAMGDRILENVDASCSRIPTPDWTNCDGLLTALVGALRRAPGMHRRWPSSAFCSRERGRIWPSRRWTSCGAHGFDVRQSADLSRAALQTAIMLVSGRPGAETTVAAGRAGRGAGRETGRARRRCPSDRFPHLVECADALTDCDDEAAYYGAGIDLFMAGVSTLAERQAVGR